MPDVDKILEALRPAHLPPAAAALTIGDIALPVAIGLLLALVVAALWPTRIKGRRRVALGVLKELKRSRGLPPDEARLAQARLLRRFVALRDGDAAADLKGADFAAHLDRSFSTDFFSAGAGRRLAVSLYEPANTNEAAAEQETIGRTLEGLFRGIRA